MEKFFIINKDSQLYNLYFEYIKDLEINRKVYGEFSREHGIEAGSYIPDKDYLIICLLMILRKSIVMVAEGNLKSVHELVKHGRKLCVI